MFAKSAPRAAPALAGTLLIADDHEVFRLGLGQVMLEKLGIGRLVEAASFSEALQRLDDPAVFLALFDLGMPGLDNPRELERVRRRRPDVRLVVVSGSDSRDDILAALSAGVHGYIVKNARPQAMIAAIERVLAGEIYVPPSIAEIAVPPPVATGQPTAAIGALTGRQREVLKLMAEGLSNKAIGRRLGISEGTVKMHVSVVLRAVGAENRTQAAALGKRLIG